MRANKRGRPRRDLDLDRIHQFRAEGWSYTEIALELGVGKSTLWYALNPVRKTFVNSQEATFPFKAGPALGSVNGHPEASDAQLPLERQEQRQKLLNLFNSVVSTGKPIPPLAWFIDRAVPRGYSRSDVEWGWREAGVVASGRIRGE